MNPRRTPAHWIALALFTATLILAALYGPTD